MHYFTDYSQLQTQSLGDAFGPNSNDPTKKFNVTSQLQLSGQAKAFACQDSIMIVQQSSANSAMVNIILKPIEGLKIPFNSVNYFVYRGLLKSSFISGTAVKPKTDSTKSDFITRFWDTWDSYKTTTNQPTLIDPTPQSFGYDSTLPDGLVIENIYDNSQQDVKGLFVKEGEWIGDFGNSSKIGLEVIIEAESFTLNLGYLRAEKCQIDVSGLSGLGLRAERDRILSYIDPAAFYGLHYDTGVNTTQYIGTNKLVETKKKADLYTLLLDKFATKNRVYLDIRSEKGFSYNFYQNYDDGSGNNIKIGNSTITPTAQVYGNNDWPIVIYDTSLATTASTNDLKINLRIDDNTKPILFIENTDLLPINNRIRFLDETQILNGIGWSKDLTFSFPNTGTGSSRDNIAYYIKLSYFRQESNPSSPSTVLKCGHYFDNIFGTLDMPHLGDTNHFIQQAVNRDLFFIKGEFPTSEKFSYVAGSGAFYDTSRVAFYAQMAFPNTSSQRFYLKTISSGIESGLNLEGAFNKMSFLAKDVGITKFHIQEIISPAGYQKIGILDIFAYNGFASSEESIFVLGITHSELVSLKSVTGLSDKHPRYIVFEDVSPSPAADKNGKAFRKYKLKVQGLAGNGDCDIQTPPTDVFVYTSRGFVFSSKAFSDAETLATTATYLRNYEEKIGFDNIKKDDGNRYEDYFIDIDNGMKTEVDGFISTLSAIQDDHDFFHNVKALVEDSARDIWDQAVNYVQTDLKTAIPHPDDRPLYWARIKMQVALKSHTHFNGGKNNSDLDNLIRLFEEKSRNYTGIDFSGAPAGAKKILITGFDPFFLNPQKGDNVLQSNPSGASILGLHKSLVSSGGKNGYIQSVIFPVRFDDFDQGVVEKVVFPIILNNSIDMIVTISQGDANYDIERFAANFRNLDSVHYDNLGKSNIPAVFYLPDSSNKLKTFSSPSLVSFLETTLPYHSIVPGTLGNNKAVFNQRYISDNPLHKAPYSGTGSGTNLISAPPSNVKAKYGSGGDYLSNEIFYRVALIRSKVRSSFKSGHLHVPALQIVQTNIDYGRTENLISNVKIILQDAVSTL